MDGSAIVYMNGALLRADEVKVSPFDLGLTVGVGIFETLPAYGGKVFALERHRQRMAANIEVVSSHETELIPVEEMRTAIEAVLLANNFTQGLSRVRVSLSGGVNPLQGGSAPGNLMITAVRRSEPEPMAKLEISPFPYNEFSGLAGVKSASFGDNVQAWRLGLSYGLDEVVRLNTQGDLCECAMSNLFLVQSGEVITPTLDSGCLDGVTRGIVMELCEELEIEVFACELDEDDLYAADEIFITSSIREVQSAEMVGEECDKPKPVTEALRMAYRARVQRELA